MGVLADRAREHLGTSDIPIIAMRRRLLEDAKALRDHQVEPLATQSAKFGVRSWTALLDAEIPFDENPEVPIQTKARA
jgi:hypothetical protein